MFSWVWFDFLCFGSVFGGLIEFFDYFHWMDLDAIWEFLEKVF